MMKAGSSTRRSKRPAAPTSARHVVQEFRRIADGYFDETFERFPEYGSQVGLAAYEPKLSGNTPAVHEAQNRLNAETLARIEALPEALFRGDDYLDRRGLLAMLRTGLLNDRTLERWRNNPQIHANAAIDSIFDLVVRNSSDLRSVLPAIESRLAKLPDFLSAAADCVRLPIPLWTDLTEKVAAGGAEFLDGLKPQLAAVSAHPPRTMRLLDGAARAFGSFASAIRRKKAGPVHGYRIGRDAFELLMRERLGFDQSLPEVEADGRRLVAELDAALDREARRIGRKKANDLLAEAREAWTPSRPLLDEYRDVTFAIRDRLASLDLVTMPRGESLRVLPVPPFLRHQFPTAAYNQPPAFSKKQVGIFWVNDLSLTQSDPNRRRGEIRQHYGLELTAAHEAYPGHHLQFAIQNQHKSRIRRLFAHSIFYEGWTLWCEKMCIDQGLVDLPYARLMQIHDALWRAYRILIDCGLHNGKLTHRSACRVLMDGVGFTRARAEGDLNWYTSHPTVPMSYLLGRLEVERLHDHFVAREGWSLRQFNDWMLGHGAIPWRWIMDARVRG
jgi:uncharacterized protein (DUF885 family)